MVNVPGRNEAALRFLAFWYGFDSGISYGVSGHHQFLEWLTAIVPRGSQNCLASRNRITIGFTHPGLGADAHGLIERERKFDVSRPEVYGSTENTYSQSCYHGACGRVPATLNRRGSWVESSV